MWRIGVLMRKLSGAISSMRVSVSVSTTGMDASRLGAAFYMRTARRNHSGASAEPARASAGGKKSGPFGIRNGPEPHLALRDTLSAGDQARQLRDHPSAA